VEIYFEIPIRCNVAVFKLITGTLHLMQPDYQDVGYIQDFQDGTKCLASVEKDIALAKF
jgi:hypothetical protein